MLQEQKYNDPSKLVTDIKQYLNNLSQNKVIRQFARCAGRVPSGGG